MENIQRLDCNRSGGDVWVGVGRKDNFPTRKRMIKD